MKFRFWDAQKTPKENKISYRWSTVLRYGPVCDLQIAAVTTETVRWFHF